MNPSDKETSEPLVQKSAPFRPVKKKRRFFRFLILVLSYVIVAAVVWKVAEQWKIDPVKQQARAEQEVRNTVEKVRKLMILPAIDVELPQVATISDAANLSKTQAFFADVKDGDQVLIYLKGQKAIIYRSSENKIVNVGPVISDNSTATNTGSGSSAKPAVTTSTGTSSPKTNNGTSTTDR